MWECGKKERETDTEFFFTATVRNTKDFGKMTLKADLEFTGLKTAWNMSGNFTSIE
jgi:hypothetical protein